MEKRIGKIMFNEKMYEITGVKNIEFKNNYAIVEGIIELEESATSPYISRENRHISVTGVIDKEYNDILPFSQEYSQISILPKNNIIVRKNIINEDGSTVGMLFHGKKVNQKWESKQLGVLGYKVINDSTIELVSANGNNRSLYSIISSKYISNNFNDISKFEKINNDDIEKFALATKIKKLSSGEIIEFKCYIDEKGKIRTPLHSSCTPHLMDVTNDEFDNMVCVISEIEEKKTKKIKENLSCLSSKVNKIVKYKNKI